MRLPQCLCIAPDLFQQLSIWLTCALQVSAEMSPYQSAFLVLLNLPPLEHDADAVI